MSQNPFLDRNVALIRERMLAQLDASLKKGAHYIDQELEGPQYFLIRPIVRGFYDLFARPDINSGSKGNLNICITAGKEAVMNPEKDLDDIVAKHFPAYLKNDQTAKFCNKNHKNYQWFVENTRKTFKAQVKNLLPLLMVDDPSITGYDDLARAAYKNVETARNVLSEQITFMEEGINKIATDPSILTVPAGKDLILRVLQRGIKDTKEELLNSVNSAFQGS